MATMSNTHDGLAAYELIGILERRNAELEAENERLQAEMELVRTQQLCMDAITKDAERYRLARKFEFLTDRQLLSIEAVMEEEPSSSWAAIDAAMKGGE